MEQPRPSPVPEPHSMLDVLDRTLANHLERITGTREGIHGLPLGLVAVACIVLMSERAGGAEAPRGARPLDRAELREGLSEMGLDEPGRLEPVLDAMVRKGYLELDARERLLPCKPTLSMARLLDHAFPGMPGINLVAYFVQTLDEVETGRKEARNAVLQLDQMLRRHGAAPFRKSKAERENRAASPERPRLRRPARLKAPSRQELEALRHDPAALGEPAPENTPIPEAEAVPEAQAVPEAEALPEPPAPTGMPEGEPAAGFHEGEEGGLDQAAVCGNPEEEESAAETSPQEAESVLPDPEHSPTIAPDETVPEAPPWGTVEGTVQDPLEEAKPVSDPEAQVEDQVSAFEERLAMQCPVCRKASVEVRETAKGRVFYQCADEECMFISWGRPHHIPCPLCGNPFLVERDVAGDPKPLKCPRATCRYRETASGEAQKTGEVGTGEPKPRRRVVRRKVRRRKR